MDGPIPCRAYARDGRSCLHPLVMVTAPLHREARRDRFVTTRQIDLRQLPRTQSRSIIVSIDSRGHVAFPRSSLVLVLGE